MTYRIEKADSQQRKYLKGFLAAFCLSVVLLAVRALFYYGFNEYDLNSKPIGIAVLVATIVGLITAVYFLAMLSRLKIRINADPKLKEALIDDELTKLHAVESWKPAFIGAVATPYAFLIVSSFYPFHDLLTIAFTTSIVGFGAYLISYYLKSRS
jgi:hypothetical protein